MRLATIALVLTCVGCSTPPPQPLTAEQREAFIVTGWQPAIPAREDAIVAKFGSSVSITREPQHNRHVEGQIDHWADLEYPMLKVKLYQMPDSELVTRVEVSDPAIIFAHGVRVGMPIQHVRALLGVPDADKFVSLRYEVHFGFGSSVTFHAQSESVERIVWVHEID
jgi:hypothetical protein